MAGKEVNITRNKLYVNAILNANDISKLGISSFIELLQLSLYIFSMSTRANAWTGSCLRLLRSSPDHHWVKNIHVPLHFYDPLVCELDSVHSKLYHPVP